MTYSGNLSCCGFICSMSSLSKEIIEIKLQQRRERDRLPFHYLDINNIVLEIEIYTS